MRKYAPLYLGILVLAFMSIQTTYAQKIKLPSPDFKKDMMEAFSPSDIELSIDASKKEELKKSNGDFLDQVIKIAGSDSNDEEKKKSILSLGKKQSNAFSKILGENNAKKYKKSIKKKIRPFKTKYKLATLIL